MTPEQLRDRLRELGIARDLRTLTDWRQKGLLPPLERASLGRGRGVQRYWSEDVLDQAIAVDCLVKRYGTADETLFGLWLVGYPVDHAVAQQAWIESVKRMQHRRRQAASRYRGGFPGLGRSWWKRLKSHVAFALPWWQELPSSDRERISEFLGDTQEWLRDEENRDDDAYRYAIADLIIGLAKIDRKSFYRWIDDVWADIDPASLFAITPYLELVQSMSLEELDAAQESLASVTNMIRRAVELFGSADCVNAVVIPLLLMKDFLGTMIARILIKTNRAIPEMPLEETIALVHDVVMRVQLPDITKKSDGGVVFAERMHIEWEATKKKLSQVWEERRERWRSRIENQRASLNGRRDPDSG